MQYIVITRSAGALGRLGLKWLRPGGSWFPSGTKGMVEIKGQDSGEDHVVLDLESEYKAICIVQMVQQGTPPTDAWNWLRPVGGMAREAPLPPCGDS